MEAVKADYFWAMDLEGDRLKHPSFREGNIHIECCNGVLHLVDYEADMDFGVLHSGYLELRNINIYATRGPQNGIYSAVWFKEDVNKFKGAVLMDAWGMPIEKESVKWFFDSLNEMRDEEFPIEVPGMTHKAHATFKVFKLGFIPDVIRDIKWEA